MENVVIVFADKELIEEEQQEFVELVKACEMNIQQEFIQTLREINFRTYIGKGKCEEIRDYLIDKEVTHVVFDHDLTPLQIRNLEEYFQVPVMDRTELILAIFEKRAVSRVARLQVEQASLSKLLPRLIGANTQLGRQSGSGKNKGAGEKQLELDRRRIKSRISEVNRELKKVELERMTQRKARQKSDLPLVSLVGYTNAGKSTILNRMLDQCSSKEEKKVLEKDMLFATLDTSIRQIKTKDGDEFLLSDTVGFVSELPHSLIKAFHSTLEEVKYASLLLQVVDASSSQHINQMEITQETLQEIGASHIPMITIYNKCDQCDYHYPQVSGNDIYMSAKENIGFDELYQMIHQMLYPNECKVHLVLPYEKSKYMSELIRKGHIISRKDEVDGISLEILLNEDLLKKYDAYIKK